MSDFTEQIRNREESLKQTVQQIIGQNPVNDVYAAQKVDYTEAFLSREVSEQERFKRLYRSENDQIPEENVIKAPLSYEPEDFKIQERKYGYFAKRSRTKAAKKQTEAWLESIDSYITVEAEDRYEFELSENVNEDTMDFMLSTRRLMAIESKKRELVSNILTNEALNALKTKSEVSASVLNDYKTTILRLGPAIEPVPKNDESLTDEISFTQESIQAYEAYLKSVVADPIATIKAAITDTLHTVTSIPEKLLGKKSIPQTFDRLMQMRDRFNSINKLRKNRQLPKNVNPENDPLGALMTKLFPREDTAAEKRAEGENEHAHEHVHDEKDNFEFIKLMEKAINSDMISCLQKAGFTFKRGLFGEKNRNYIDSDGNAALNAYKAAMNTLSKQSESQKAEKKALNNEHWAEREKEAYSALRAQHNENNTDPYKIMLAVNKIKTEAAGKQKIKYNTQLASKLENRIAMINSAIDDLRFKADHCQQALLLDNVKMSRELTGRMKANAQKAQYDIVILLERVKGYINAYDHTVSGKKLNEFGKPIMEEMQFTETEDGWNVYEENIDTRYSTDSIDRMNRIYDSKNRVADNNVKSDREAVVKLKEALGELDKNSSNVLHEIRSINRANKNTVIDKIIDFRKNFYSADNLIKYKLTNEKSACQGLFMSIQDTKIRSKAMQAYQHTMAKCHFICTYADLFRTENIIGTYTAGKLPVEIVLSEEEKRLTQKDFSKEKKSISLLLDAYLKEITEYENAQGVNAIRLNLFDEDPEAGEGEIDNTLESLLSTAQVESFSDVQQDQNVAPIQNVQQPVHVENEQQNGQNEPVVEHVEQEQQHEPVIEHIAEEQQREPVADQQGQQQQPQIYEKRVVSEAALEIINENSLDTTEKFVRFIASQLKQLNKINHVKWDEVKKESRAWLIGKTIAHQDNQINLSDENIDNVLEQLRQGLIQAGDITDESQYSDEEKRLFEEEGPAEQYREGSVSRMFKDALHLNSIRECGKFSAKKVSKDTKDSDVINNFKTSFAVKFDDNVANIKVGRVKTKIEDISIPEQDEKHVKWFIDHFPQNIRSMKDVSDFNRLWAKKVGYDMLNGHKLDERTYKKIKCVIESMQAAIERTVNVPQGKKALANLNKVKLNTKIPDRELANEEETIPNVKQWYGMSCWATSGALIANWYMKNTLKIENPPLIDQMTFLDPTNIVLNPYAEDALKTERLSAKTGEMGMNKELNNIKNFVKPEGSTGNIMTTADVMLSKMSNTALRHMRFNMPLNDRYFNSSELTGEQWNKLSKQIFIKISNLMQQGSGPISMLLPGHYRTIIGFKDGKLRVRDSSLANGNVEVDLSVEDFTQKLKAAVRDSGYSFELVYLQNLTDEKKDEIKREYGVEYDHEGKLKYTEKDEQIHAGSPTNIMHNLGLSFEKKTRDNENILERFMQDEIYVPKNLDHTKNIEEVEQKKAQKRRDLRLEEATEEQLQLLEQQKTQFDQTAQIKRNEEKINWEQTVVKTGNAVAEQKAKKIFNERFTDEEKEELIKKTINFDKQLKGKAKLKKKEKEVKPTQLDVFYADYEQKSAEHENDLNSAQGMQKRKNDFGWILSAKDMKNVESMLAKKDAGFANKVVETKESSVKARNKAIETIKKGDISMYNHLPAFLKEYYGRISLAEFFGENKYFKAGIIPSLGSLTEDEKNRLASKTRDPVFRGIINMMIVRRAKDGKGNEAWKRLRAYDSFMNRQLIMQTLAPMEAQEKQMLRVENASLKKSKFDGRESADTMIANNTIKQRHIAKTMFLMQLGRFDRFDTDKDNNQTVSMFDQNIAEAIAHGTRVGINLPAGKQEDQKRVFDAWQGKAANMMFSRFATHELHRKKVNDDNSFFKEIKLKGMHFKFKKLFKHWHEERPSSYSDNYGLNIALGGLGKKFNGSVIDDQGKFAHIYQRFRMGDENTCGGMLVGIENSAPGGTCVTNLKQYFGGYDGTSCIGELHNGKAIAHGQSAFFSSREFLGDQYSGRVVDLSNINANDLADVIKKFDEKYEKMQKDVSSSKKNVSDKARADLKLMNSILSGRILTAQELYGLLRTIGFTQKKAKDIANSARSKNGASYTSDNSKYPEKMYKAQTERELERQEANNDNVEDFFAQYQEMRDDAGEEQQD